MELAILKKERERENKCGIKIEIQQIFNKNYFTRKSSLSHVFSLPLVVSFEWLNTF